MLGPCSCEVVHLLSEADDHSHDFRCFQPRWALVLDSTHRAPWPPGLVGALFSQRQAQSPSPQTSRSDFSKPTAQNVRHSTTTLQQQQGVVGSCLSRSRGWILETGVVILAQEMCVNTTTTILCMHDDVCRLLMCANVDLAGQASAELLRGSQTLACMRDGRRLSEVKRWR